MAERKAVPRKVAPKRDLRVASGAGHASGRRRRTIHSSSSGASSARQPHDYKQHGLGSGVIVSSDGYILTNNHVVGGAEEIHVTLMDKREFTAKVIGKDAKTDLALIKIDSKDPLPVAELGNSDAEDVGDWVVAIGNPFGFTLTTTAGIVSAKGRMLGGNYDDFIQTDASINPGNSGGPLFNTAGQVIGINTAIYSRTGTNAGIGFAIPVNLAKHVMDQLKSHGRVVRGWLGVEIQEVTPDLAQSFGLAKPEGALVASVDKDGPAAKSGLERGDVVLKFNGKDVHDEHELPVLVADTPINKKVPVEVVRNGKHQTLEVTVGELKEAPVQTAKAEEPGTNWGMQVGDITPEIASQFHLTSDKGVVVRHVAPDTPAADAGIQPGDLDPGSRSRQGCDGERLPRQGQGRPRAAANRRCCWSSAAAPRSTR